MKVRIAAEDMINNARRENERYEEEITESANKMLSVCTLSKG